MRQQWINDKKRDFNANKKKKTCCEVEKQELLMIYNHMLREAL
jgi:hypothetical protein